MFYYDYTDCHVLKGIGVGLTWTWQALQLTFYCGRRWLILGMYRRREADAARP